MGGVDGHERYAPCSLEELRLRGYDYWALGHIHARQVLSRDPPVVFAGNVQGRHIRELGPKGCVLATIRPDHSIEHAFHRLDQARWECGVVDVSDLHTESEILGRAAEVLEQLLASEVDGLLAVRLIFRGATSVHGRLQGDSERFIAEIRSLATELGTDRLWIEKVEARTQPQRALSRSEGPMEELLEVLEKLRADPDSLRPVMSELAELKRKLPAELLNSPDSPRLDDAAWLQSLLERAQPMLLDLLMKSNGGPPSRSAK